MPETFEEIERRLGGKGGATATAPKPDSFDAIEARLSSRPIGWQEKERVLRALGRVPAPQDDDFEGHPEDQSVRAHAMFDALPSETNEEGQPAFPELAGKPIDRPTMDRIVNRLDTEDALSYLREEGQFTRKAKYESAHGTTHKIEPSTEDTMRAAMLADPSLAKKVIRDRQRAAEEQGRRLPGARFATEAVRGFVRGATLGYVDPLKMAPEEGAKRYASGLPEYRENLGTAGRIAQDIPEVVGTLGPYGVAAKAVGGKAALAGIGAAGPDKSIDERIAGGLSNLLLAHGAGKIGGALEGWLSRLEPVQRSAAVARLAQFGAHGVGFATADQLLHGPDGERALSQFVFGGGIAAMHEPLGVTKGRATEARAAAGKARVASGVAEETRFQEASETVEADKATDRSKAEAKERAVATVIEQRMPAGQSERAEAAWRKRYEPEIRREVDEAAARLEARARPGEATGGPFQDRLGLTEAAETSRFPDPNRARGEDVNLAPPPEVEATAAVAEPAVEAPATDVEQPSRLVMPDEAGALPPLPRSGRAWRASERGYVQVPTLKDFKDATVRLGRATRKTVEWWSGAGLEDFRRNTSEATQSAAARLSTTREYEQAAAKNFVDYVTQGGRLVRKKTKGKDGVETETVSQVGGTIDARKVQEALNEENARSRNPSMEDAKRRLDRGGIFPSEADYQRFVRSDDYKAAARRFGEARTEIASLFDEAKGNPGPTKPDTTGVYSGVFTNLLPLDPEAHSGGTTGPSSWTVQGPRFERTAFSGRREATADAYSSDMEHVVLAGYRNRGLVLKRRLVNGLVADGKATWDRAATGSTGAKGYTRFRWNRDAGTFQVEDGEPVKGSTLYVKDEVAGQLTTLLGQERIPEPQGLGGKFSRALGLAQTKGLVDPLIHSENVIAQAIRVTGYKGLTGTVARAKAYKSDPRSMMRDQQRVADVGGSRALHENHGGLFGELGHLVSRIDLAARVQVLDAVEAKIKAGDAPDTLATRRDAVMQMGNYNALTQDWLTRGLKKIGIQPFVVAGKTMTSNAWRGLVGSKGIKPTSVAAAMRMRAEVYSRWASYLAMAGAANIASTGTPFPAGIPFGSVYLGKKDGRPRALTLPMDVMGLGRVLRYTGLSAAIDRLREGAPKDIPASMMTAILRRATHASVIGPPVETGLSAFGAKWGNIVNSPDEGLGALVHVNPIVESIVAAFEGDYEKAASSQLGSVVVTGRSAKDVGTAAKRRDYGEALNEIPAILREMKAQDPAKRMDWLRKRIMEYPQEFRSGLWNDISRAYLRWQSRGDR